MGNNLYRNDMVNAGMGIEPKRTDMFLGKSIGTKIFEFMSMVITFIASGTRVHKYYFYESSPVFQIR